MPGLAETQHLVRHAVVRGEAAALLPLLRGGVDPLRRLAVHRRHYQASLVTTLLKRFPATIWLVGSEPLAGAARQFVECHPPGEPCLAEYGERFPAFLATYPSFAHLSYLAPFAELEWHVGRLSLAVESTSLQSLPPVDSAGELRIGLQPSVHYLRLDWPLDSLLRLYLTDSAPDTFALSADTVWLQLRGVRGDVDMRRLSHSTFAFRSALAGGATLVDAASRADDRFDLVDALRDLLAEGLVTAVNTRRHGETHR